MTCKYIITRGKNKGKICGKNKCSKHKTNEPQIKCEYVFTRGKNKGNKCGKINCSKHKTKSVSKTVIEQVKPKPKPKLAKSKQQKKVNLDKLQIVEENIDLYTDYQLTEFNNDQLDINNISLNIFNNELLYKNVLQLIKLRQYKINLEKENEIHTDKCIILYSNNNKVNIVYIKNIMKYLNEMNFNNVILIYKDNITSSVKKIIELSDDIKFELFNEDEICYNITNHYLVPKHELVTDINVINKLKNLDFKNLPIILKDDPVVRYHNFKIGDLIKIYRNNGNIVYRIVK